MPGVFVPLPSQSPLSTYHSGAGFAGGGFQNPLPNSVNTDSVALAYLLAWLVEPQAPL